MSYWYIARANELLIDLDDYTRPAKSGGPWGEIFFRRRLRDAILDRKLDVYQVILAKSTTDKHYHALVELEHDMDVFERLTWQLHLGSDLYRGRADLMRAARGNEFPTLLIRDRPLPEGERYVRVPDAICRCKVKHVTSDRPTCKVWHKYRGESPWDLFGRSEKRNESGVPLPIGRVPLRMILEVRT